jgi:hypothetical protein
VDCKVTEAHRFFLGRDRVTIEMSDPIAVSGQASGWYWRLVVNGEAGPWTSIKEDILYHNGYIALSPYFEGTGLKVETPFRVIPTTMEDNMTMLEIAKALREMNLKDPNAWADELILKADNGPRFEKISELSIEFVLKGGLNAKEYIEKVIEHLMETSFDPDGAEPIVAFATALAMGVKQEDEEAEAEEGLEDDSTEEEDAT